MATSRRELGRNPACRAACRDEARAPALATELRDRCAAIETSGATPPLADRVDAWGERARRLLAHRHHLLEQMGALAEELTAGFG